MRYAENIKMAVEVEKEIWMGEKRKFKKESWKNWKKDWKKEGKLKKERKSQKKKEYSWLSDF